MSFSSAYRLVNQLAATFRKIGIKPGDTVALDLPANLHLLFAQALFHEAAIGCQLPTGPAQNGNFTCDWLFSDSLTSSTWAKKVVKVDSALLKEVHANSDDFIMPRRYSEPESICRIVFSSGTTGQPKPIALTLEMIENRAAVAPGYWMHTPPFMTLLDLSTVSGFQTFYSSVIHGQTYLVPGSASHNVAQIKRHNVASIKASPWQITELTKELQRTGEELPSLEIIHNVGSTLPARAADAARATTGAKIYNLYGSTECGILTTRFEESNNPFDVGTLVSGAELQIVDELDCKLPDGQIGTIRYKKEFQVQSYLNDANSTEQSYRDGWFYPGDTGFISNEDTLILAGRTSEIINVGGVKIDPAAVDQVAVEISGVLDVAGFGYENELGMIEFALAVVTGENFDSELLIEKLKLEFGPARPQAIVILEEIPRNLMGKPLRSELARQYTEKREKK